MSRREIEEEITKKRKEERGCGGVGFFPHVPLVLSSVPVSSVLVFVFGGKEEQEDSAAQTALLYLPRLQSHRFHGGERRTKKHGPGDQKTMERSDDLWMTLTAVHLYRCRHTARPLDTSTRKPRFAVISHAVISHAVLSHAKWDSGTGA
jgi:hypothetical protein